jgi:hypothetical protein
MSGAGGSLPGEGLEAGAGPAPRAARPPASHTGRPTPPSPPLHARLLLGAAQGGPGA